MSKDLSLPKMFVCRSLLLLSLEVLLQLALCGQEQDKDKKKPPVPGPMLSDGTVQFDTPEFSLSMVRSSQTVAALRPKGEGDFDFTPGDLLLARSNNGYFHLGDVTLRLRAGRIRCPSQ